MLRIVAMVLIVLPLLTAEGQPAFAQTESGATELQVQGTLNLGLSKSVQDTGAVFLSWGRFVSRNNELGLTAGGAFTSDGDFGGFAGPFWRLNFGNGKTVPYLGASAAAPFGDYVAADVSVVASLEAGVRWFVQRNLAFSVAGNTYYLVEENEFSDNLQILFGFSAFWGK